MSAVTEQGINLSWLVSSLTSEIYEISARQISPYFDSYTVKSGDWSSQRILMDVFTLHNWQRKALDPSLENVAALGAKKALAAEEIKRIGNSLIEVVTCAYEIGEKKLQKPELKLSEAGGSTSGIFIAHFLDYTGQTLEETLEQSKRLRCAVFSGLDKIEGFTLMPV